MIELLKECEHFIRHYKNVSVERAGDLLDKIDAAIAAEEKRINQGIKVCCQQFDTCNERCWPLICNLRKRLEDTEEKRQPLATKYSDIIATQRREAEHDPSDAYHVGLLNGMLLICANEDNSHYAPMDCKKREPDAWHDSAPAVPPESRGEYICQKCGLRQDATTNHGEPEF